MHKNVEKWRRVSKIVHKVIHTEKCRFKGNWELYTDLYTLSTSFLTERDNAKTNENKRMFCEVVPKPFFYPQNQVENNYQKILIITRKSRKTLPQGARYGIIRV